MDLKPKNLQSAYEYLDAIFSNLPSLGIAILEGPEFRYVKINTFLANLNGVSIADHIGKTVEEVLPHAAVHIIPNFRQVWKSGKPSPQREICVKLPNNPDKVFHVIDFHFPIIIDGKIRAIGAIVIDITDRKILEKQLQAQTRLLQIANHAQSVFIADASHELRTPLAIAIANIDLALWKNRKNTTDPYETLSIVYEELERMASTIEV